MQLLAEISDNLMSTTQFTKPELRQLLESVLEITCGLATLAVCYPKVRCFCFVLFVFAKLLLIASGSGDLDLRFIVTVPYPRPDCAL